jgi:hypothetical protein
MMNLGCLTQAIWLLTLTAVTAFAQIQEQFQVDAARPPSRFGSVGRGVFAFAGHDHEIVAHAVNGNTEFDRSNVDRSSVSLEF